MLRGEILRGVQLLWSLHLSHCLTTAAAGPGSSRYHLLLCSRFTRCIPLHFMGWVIWIEKFLRNTGHVVDGGLSWFQIHKRLWVRG